MIASRAPHGRWWVRAAGLVAACALTAWPGGVTAAQQGLAPDVLVKAAFIFNFAKFTEWPALPPAAPLVACVVGDDEVAAALATTIRGQQVSGRAVEVSRPPDPATWPACHLLFIAEPEARRAAGGLTTVKTRPILTVSDSKDFARSDGIIELYLEQGRMRFAINTDAAGRAGLHISSRLLGLARVIRDRDAR